MNAFSRCCIGVVLALFALPASPANFLTVAPVTSPQRAGVSFPISIRAHEANGGVDTNFSGPVRLLFSDSPAPVLFANFNSGLGGWTCGCQSGGNFSNSQFDTDGDGATDGSLAVSLNSQVCWSYINVTLVSGVVYTVSMDLAFRGGPGGGNQLFQADLVLNSTQVGVWALPRVGPNEVSRGSVQTTFIAPVTGTALLDVRFWAPLSSSATAYMDNVVVRERELDPVVVRLVEGEATVPVRSYRNGANLVLRAESNGGLTEESNPFEILPWSTDASVVVPDSGLRPAGIPTWITVLVSNAGPSVAEGLRLTNELPEHVIVQPIGLREGCAIVENTVICDLPLIESESVFALQIPVVSAMAGVAEVHATVALQAHDNTPANQESTGIVHFVPLLRGSNVTVTEHPEGTNAVFTFELTAPLAAPISANVQVIPLSATTGLDYSAPTATTIQFAVGETQQVFTVEVNDDLFWEPAEQFAVVLSLESGAPLLLEYTQLVASVVSDDPLPTLTIMLPEALVESAGIVVNGGTLVLSAALDSDLVVSLSSGDETELVVPQSAVIPAGETSVSFDLHVIDDTEYDLTRVPTVSAETTNGIWGVASVVIQDDELPPITLSLFLQFPIEGLGTVSNGLRITIPAPLVTNLTIVLTSGDTSELVVAEQVVLNAGQSTAQFPLTIVDDDETDGPVWVTLSATAAGFADANLNVLVRDNDVHHFRFDGKQTAFVTSTVPFAIRFSALDFSNNLVTSFTGPVTLSATGSVGTVVLEPTLVTNFSRGSWFGNVTILNGAHTDVRLIASDDLGRVGYSDPFTVYAAPLQVTRLGKITITGGEVRIQFTSVDGRTYRVECSPSPAGPWQPAMPEIIGTGEMITVTHENSVVQPQQFYRVVLVAPGG